LIQDDEGEDNRLGTHEYFSWTCDGTEKISNFYHLCNLRK
jgi:hypothetical protein